MDTSTLKITHPILKLVAEIDEFKGRWGAVNSLSTHALQQLREHSNIESIGASNRIDGISFSNEKVAAFLSESIPGSVPDGAEAETAGYAAALKMVCEESDSDSLTEIEIRKIHATLVQFSGKNRHPGEYKRNHNFIAAFDDAGKHVGILFEAASPMQTSAEMAKLMEWLDRVEEDKFHPLIITAIFIFRFLVIHPFQDGNGRLSCILATTLLLRFGYSYMPYVSLEKMIEENRTAFYSSLRLTHQSLKWATPELEIWIEFFLACLVQQKRKLEKRIEVEQAAPLEMSDLAQTIVDMLETQPKVTVASVVQATGASRPSVRTTLRRLVLHSLVVPKGKGRGSHYSFLK